MSLTIDYTTVFTDNYVWLLRDEASGKCAVVDPGQSQPVLDALERKHWGLDWIINTHHHWDHTGGNETLKQMTGCKVAGAAVDAHRIPGIDRTLVEGDVFCLGGSSCKVLFTPGHTNGHL